ncbi:Hypothetical protein Nlim_1607 [Candidatus Nitrosarchaeum limnium SFB1]|jgi:hypothetical protein|uniref:Uncharacterized protein n=1 Tax=Candidatus Nitrosarchaeum limnium SFB1 TaxID=886738 RepID=F3KM77_9ARCH|nr:Hypothetical protein Nlim_1607 [Candidatus Nitrosarchaeum limnium SFB1]
MKTTTIGMFAAIAFAVGMVGINFSDGQLNLQDDTPASTMEGGSILGHIELIHTDKDGNVVSYQQTDNAIVNDGRNCVAMLLFGPNSGCRASTASGLGKYTVIGVGNGSALSGSTSQLILNGGINDNGIVRTTGTLDTFTNATNNSDPAVQRIKATFTWSGATTNVVTQAGLFNDTALATTTSTFAVKNFPSSVSMNTGDQLTVNWDITIDGSDAFS